MTTTNPHKRPVILDSIDVSESFLAGFQVVSVDPQPTGTVHIPVFDQRSWSFGISVAPGDTLSATFRLEPVEPGHFSGDIDVCNPNQDFTTLFVDVVVKEQGVENQGR